MILEFLAFHVFHEWMTAYGTGEMLPWCTSTHFSQSQPLYQGAFTQIKENDVNNTTPVSQSP